MKTGHAHWQINEPDARRYAIGWANVFRHYSVKATQKAIDHMALLFIAVEVEGPRIALTVAMNKQAAEAAKQSPGAAGATVYRFNNSPPPAGAEGSQ